MIPRYGPEYRQKELIKICEYAQRGDSLAFVGIAGTGKSNIMSFLCKDPYGYKHQYLHDNVDKIHFVLIDATTWERTAGSLLEMMYDALSEVRDKLSDNIERPNITLLAPDGEHTKRRLNDLVEWFCHKLGHRLMFILDDFDTILETGPLSTVEELSRLRNANKGLVSYLMFTKALPHILGLSHDLENKSKFYDLFKGNIFSLGLYSDNDSRQMLLHLNEVAGNPLHRGDLLTIQHFGGGHARLIKLLFECWRQNPPPAERAFEYFCNQLVILKECERILNGLLADEREIIRQIDRNISLDSIESGFIDYLQTRGLLNNIAPIKWFSPLISAYLKLPFVSDADNQISYVWQRKEMTEFQQDVNIIIAIVEYFFSLAQFNILDQDINHLAWAQSNNDRWKQFGKMPVIIAESDPAYLMSDLGIAEAFDFLELNSDVRLAFLITINKLSPDAIRQIWEIQKRAGFIIIPIHIGLMQSILQYSNPNVEGKFNQLQAEWKTLIDPFAAISSINNPDWFFGPNRNQDAAEILQEVTHQRSSGYYAIYGMRRVGKTSLINQIRALANQNQHIVSVTLCRRVFSNDYTHKELLFSIIKELARSIKEQIVAIDDKLPDLSDKEYVIDNWRQLAENLIQAYRVFGDSRLIILLDEVDVIFPNLNSPKMVYDEYIAFSQSLKELLENSEVSPIVSLIVVMEHDGINTENKFDAQLEFQNPFFGRFRLSKTLLPLTQADWSDMMHTIGARAGIVFAKDGLDLLFEQSGGHPEIARYVGSILIEERFSGMNVEIADIHSALALALNRNSVCAHYLRENFWENRLSADRNIDKRVLQLVSENEELTLDVFKNMVQIEYLDELNRAEKPYSDEEFNVFFNKYEGSLRRLVALSILSEDSNRFSFTIPLLRRWIRSETLGLGGDEYD